MEWRSPLIAKWLRVFDCVHLSTRFNKAGRATKGAFPRHRVSSDRMEHSGTPVKGLPRNFYNSMWLETLEDHEMESLDVQSNDDLTHTDSILA